MNKLIGRRYNIYEKLGHGNFGSVYKGKHSKHNTDVAIKLESIYTKIKLPTIINDYKKNHPRERKK